MKIILNGRVPSKKNSKQIFRGKNGRPFITASQKFKEWESQTLFELNKLSIEKIEKVSEIKIHFIFGDKRKQDLTNKAESVMDALVDADIIEDDNYMVIPKITLTGAYEKSIWTTEVDVKK